jgi:adenosylcobinamide kinase/adenosylcobinamide-phosphate guanylyltransferase
MALDLGTGSTLVLGGARSGKSRFAESLVIGSRLKPLYVATASAGDEEMTARIEEHRQRRGRHWLTIEEPVNLTAVLGQLARADTAVLVDCLTLWLNNLMMRGIDIATEVEELAGIIPALAGPVVFVSNEVGLGLVPDNPMGREFRDHAGRLNQVVAARAARVYFVAAGLPLALKQ